MVGVLFHNEELKSAAAVRFADLFVEGALGDFANISRLIVGSIEAEAIRLFENTHLVLRASCFNELGTYAEARGLNPKSWGDRSRRVPRSPHWVPLQRPLVRVLRLLPAQGFQAASGELFRRPAEPHPRDRRLQRHPPGLHRVPHPCDESGVFGRLPPGDEGGLGQFRQSSIQGVARRLKDAGVDMPVYNRRSTLASSWACR